MSEDDNVVKPTDPQRSISDEEFEDLKESLEEAANLTGPQLFLKLLTVMGDYNPAAAYYAVSGLNLYISSALTAEGSDAKVFLENAAQELFNELTSEAASEEKS